MADLKSLAESRSALFQFDPRKLVIRDGWNARNLDEPANAAHVKELSISIASIGVKEPLAVFLEGDDVVVKNGHCRLAAVMMAIANGAEILTVPVIPEARGSNDADHVLSQIVRNSGKALTPLEQGAVFKRLLDFQWSVAKIAEKTGKSVAHINQAIQFQSAPAEVHALVTSGGVSASLAAKTIRKSGVKAGTAKLKKAVEKAKSAGKSHATEKHVEQEPPIPCVTPLEVDIAGRIGAAFSDVLAEALRKIAAAPITLTAEAMQFIAAEALISSGLT